MSKNILKPTLLLKKQILEQGTGQWTISQQQKPPVATLTYSPEYKQKLKQQFSFREQVVFQPSFYLSTYFRSLMSRKAPTNLSSWHQEKCQQKYMQQDQAKSEENS